MPRPMTPTRSATLRRTAAWGITVTLSVGLAACSTPETPATPAQTTAQPSATPEATPLPTPPPTPTPQPTPRFTNPPDDELSGILPERVNGVPLVAPPRGEYALTPGDFGTAYGEIGTRFASLVIAYVEEPRLSLYAARVDGEPVRTRDLEPHLATAGRYVGIAGLDPDPWRRARVAGKRVWVRPEDNATAAGTMIYTWSSGDIVFLLIGVDDALNRALIAELPGERAPRPTPTPTPDASPSAPASGQPASPSPTPTDG